MGVTLVIAGNHQQFVEWSRLVYGERGAWPGSLPPREMSKVEDFWGFHAEEVGFLHLIGTYWENPVWGSEPYRTLMDWGLTEAKPWAMSTAIDLKQASVLGARALVDELAKLDIGG